MQVVLIIIAVIAFLYLVFAVGPAIVAFNKVFEKKSDKPLEKLNISKTYFAPFEKDMRDAAARLEAKYEFKRVGITSFDGLPLYADYIDVGSDRTVACFHGYSAAPIINFCMPAEYFLSAGYNVLLIYQRGHSVSGGEYSALGLLEKYDVLSWVDYLDKQPVPQVVLYGISMGASTLAYASPDIKSEKVKALVIDCGYLSPYHQIYRDCVRRHLPGKLILPVINLFTKIKYKLDLKESTTEPLKHNKIPTFFLHGKADETVPYNDSEVNYSACASEKKLLLPEKLHHTLAFATGDSSVRAEVFDFLHRYIK